MQELKELGFMAISVFYLTIIIIGIVERYANYKYRQDRRRKELLHYKWEVTKAKCIY